MVKFPPSTRRKSELAETVLSLADSDLEALHMFIERKRIVSGWTHVDVSKSIPQDALLAVGSYLDASTLVEWQSCNRTMLRELDHMWFSLGSERFRNVLVSGERFEDAKPALSWFQRYVRFLKHMCIVPRSGINARTAIKSVRTDVPLYRKVSCTLPTMFGISTSGTTFLELTVSVKFSPDAVRSVVGLINSPASDSLESLQCDRGLSRKHWGLAFGPLTGVVSSQGKYFDDFSTYRARHGLKDYLGIALQQRVTVRVGILIVDRKVAFYRLPETDYADWECTGFVYEVPYAQVYPCVMFSHIGHRDSVHITVDRTGGSPPYYPHENESALNRNAWSSFAEEGLESATRPPPNSPMFEPSMFSAMETEAMEF